MIAPPVVAGQALEGIGPDGVRWQAPGAALASHASVRVDEEHHGLRRYLLQTDAARRPGSPPSPRAVSETAGTPRVRSGSVLFDALFALAVDEATHTLAVDRISDAAYNGGRDIDCPPAGCYKTGVLWTYVWTRDSAYAVDLALAQMDPRRAMNTLLFKLSDRRDAPGQPEIVQDTGSGGSWPISSDRVVWARAAWELLKYLDGDDRRRFLAAAYPAIVHTVENDRLALHDAADGLYRGEQSFLDWREQTYPRWTAERVMHIGMSKSLSTNANHWRILDVAAQMAQQRGDTTAAARYRGWADALKAAIEREFWLPDARHFASLKTTALDAAPLHRHDLLGEALTVLDGLANPAQARDTVAHYPLTPAGAPVVWPQIPGVPIYHNRAIWPFATAYGLRAARAVGNTAVFDHHLATLMRGAGLSLSNMENFDFLTLSSWAPDADNPEGHGPVIDSPAQLWSVAGYLSAVLDGVFGREATQHGLRFRPFVSESLRALLFAPTDAVRLLQLPYKGRTIDIELLPPPAPNSPSHDPAHHEPSHYEAGRVWLNGQPVAAGHFISASELQPHNTLRIELQSVPDGDTAITLLNPEDTAQLFSPAEPHGVRLQVGEDGRITVHFEGDRPASDKPGTVFNVYRNGQLVAAGVRATAWTDDDSAARSGTQCYSVEQQSLAAPHWRSHHSEPVCHVPPGGLFEQLLAPERAESTDVRFTPAVTGRYGVQTRYANALNTVNTGITAAVKRIELHDAEGALLDMQIVAMPHLRDATTQGDSTFAVFALQAGRSYRLRLADFHNMSALASNASYRGAGGADGPLNRAAVSALRIMRMPATD